MSVQLPSSFDVDDFENFFSMTLTRNNILACKRVIRKLISGEGVKHKAKPGEVFALGRVITPNDDLVALKLEAKAWLPHTGPNALDKGHGWALAHPIQKLIEYKNYLRAHAMSSNIHTDDDPDDGSEYDVPGYREAEKEYEEYLASGGYRSESSYESDESVDPDEFEVKDSDISDDGESEPSDGESLGSKDSERSLESDESEDEDKDESVVYDSKEEDELDRLDALAEVVTHAAKRQRVVESDEEEYDKKMTAYLSDCGR